MHQHLVSGQMASYPRRTMKIANGSIGENMFKIWRPFLWAHLIQMDTLHQIITWMREPTTFPLLMHSYLLRMKAVAVAYVREDLSAVSSRAQVRNSNGGGNSETNGGGGVVVSLPEDIIFDVLTRLPAKVLCRFQCVCKGWRALISEEAFVAAQRFRAAPLIAGVFRRRSRRRARKHELRVMGMDGGVLRVFVGVAGLQAPARHNDLICVRGRAPGSAAVIDPASGRLLTAIDERIPRIDAPVPACCVYSSSGRAAPSGAYKVLRIHQEQRGHVHRCEIATIKDGGAESTWRRIPVPPFPLSTSRDSSKRACTNGTLYFMLRTTDATPHGRSHIAAFNLESEEWEETIDGPAMGIEKVGEEWIIALTELKATLSMVQSQTVSPLGYKDDHGYYTNIWVLVDSKKSIWVKKYTIPMSKNMILLKALDVLEDGRISLLNGLDKRVKNAMFHRYVIQFYDPSTQAFTDLMEMAEEFEGNMALYTGSLLSSSVQVDCHHNLKF